MGPSKSESPPQQTTQTFVPWEGVEPFLRSGFRDLEQAAQAPNTYFTGNTVAPFSQFQQESFSRVPQILQNQAQGNEAIMGALDFTFNNMLNPATNPYLQRTADAAVDTVFRSLNQNVLPGISDAAIATGGVGGTRQNLATGIATQRATDQALNTSANIFSNAYQNSLGNYTNTLLNMPSILRGMSAPADTAQQFGAIQQGQQQAGINEDIARFNYNRDAPFNRLSQYMQLLMGMPGGMQQTTAGPQTNPLQAGLGTGLSAFALGANPMMSVGLGLLGALS